jgi:hypothetical protein
MGCLSREGMVTTTSSIDVCFSNLLSNPSKLPFSSLVRRLAKSFTYPIGSGYSMANTGKRELESIMTLTANDSKNMQMVNILKCFTF